MDHLLKLGLIKQINLNGKDLLGLPLFFRKIYYNPLTDIEEEEKLMKYDSFSQCTLMRDESPVLQISKTVKLDIIKSITDGE